MCVVSMVTDHYMPKWPQPAQMSPSIYKDIMELIRKAQEYDRMTGQPECPAPEKAKWLEEFEKAQIIMQPVNLNSIGPAKMYDNWPYPPEGPSNRII